MFAHGSFSFNVLLAACATGGVGARAGGVGARAGGVGARRAAWVCTASTMKKAKQGLSFENMLLRPAGTGAFLYSSLGRLREEVRVCATGVLKIIKQACPLRGGLCALRARGLFFILVWAACAAGGVGMHGEH